MDILVGNEANKVPGFIVYRIVLPIDPRFCQLPKSEGDLVHECLHDCISSYLELDLVPGDA